MKIGDVYEFSGSSYQITGFDEEGDPLLKCIKGKTPFSISPDGSIRIRKENVESRFKLENNYIKKQKLAGVKR